MQSPGRKDQAPLARSHTPLAPLTSRAPRRCPRRPPPPRALPPPSWPPQPRQLRQHRRPAASSRRPVRATLCILLLLPPLRALRRPRRRPRRRGRRLRESTPCATARRTPARGGGKRRVERSAVARARFLVFPQLLFAPFGAQRKRGQSASSVNRSRTPSAGRPWTRTAPGSVCLCPPAGRPCIRTARGAVWGPKRKARRRGGRGEGPSPETPGAARPWILFFI